jgi:ribosomal protein L11 methyltransferase
VDAGCGSGILAISASLLGFAPVRGFDVDPDAVRIARENADINGVGTETEFRLAGIPEGLSAGPADLILANIQADVLMEHAGALLAGLKPGGILCLSGILSEERAHVEDHFRSVAGEAGRSAAFESRAEGEWCDLAVPMA